MAGRSKECMTLGETLADNRRRKGYSQELLAENSKTSLRTIQRIENDSVTPRPFTLKAIATALQVPIETFQISRQKLDQADFLILRRINTLGMLVIVLPIVHILIAFLIWRRHMVAEKVREVGIRILSFQIIWLAVTLLGLILVRLIQVAITGSVAIGHVPVLSLIYMLFVLINVSLVIGAGLRLRRGDHNLFTFVPALF
jgi:transcriptional regulator with XRE-family HTH domain